MLCSLHI